MTAKLNPAVLAGKIRREHVVGPITAALKNDVGLYLREHAEAILAMISENEALRKDAAKLAIATAALRYYAERDHLFGSLPEDWDDSGDSEAAGWLWPSEPAQNEAWGVEDGLVARFTLLEIESTKEP